MNGSSNDFDTDDMALLATAQRESLESDQAAAGVAQAAEAAEAAGTPPAAPAPPAPAAAPAVSAPAPAPVAAAPAAPVAAPAVVEEQPKGNVSAALRASRHAERQARQRADQLAAEVETLRKQVPPAPMPGVLDPKTRDDLSTYVPDALALMEQKDAEIARLRAAQAPTPAPAKEFTPFVLSDSALELVDSIPELSEWHSTEAMQPQFLAAQAADLFLQKSPLWKDKPAAERFKEAVRIVKSDFGTSSAPGAAVETPAQAAQRIVDALPTTHRPVTVGGLRSGEAPANEILDFNQMVKDGASDEDIMARLN